MTVHNIKTQINDHAVRNIRQYLEYYLSSSYDANLLATLE